MEKANCPDLSVVDLGPVVQSIVSLTSSLRGQLVNKCFTTIIPNTLTFFVEKWEKLASHIFQQKYWHISDINIWNFNKTLTNDVFSFEQAGPEQIWPGNKKPGHSIQRTCLAAYDIVLATSVFYPDDNC